MRVQRSLTIAAPPDRVYDVLVDASRLADWVTIHENLVTAPRGPLRKGSKLTQQLRLSGRCFTVHWTVVENHRPRRVVWEGRGPLRSKAGVTYELEPGDDTNTHFSYTNDYDLPGGPLGKAAGPVVARVTRGELEASLEKLRGLVE